MLRASVSLYPWIHRVRFESTILLSKKTLSNTDSNYQLAASDENLMGDVAGGFLPASTSIRRREACNPPRVTNARAALGILSSVS